MTDYEQNAYCRILDDAEFKRVEAVMAAEVMQTPKDGIPVRLRIDTDLPKDGRTVLSISLGGLTDPNGVEYKGPLRDEVETRVALAEDEDSFPVFPSVRLLHLDRKAACAWEAEEGFDVVRGDAGITRRLVLRASRDPNRMGSIDVLDDG